MKIRSRQRLNNDPAPLSLRPSLGVLLALGLLGASACTGKQATEIGNDDSAEESGDDETSTTSAEGSEAPGDGDGDGGDGDDGDDGQSFVMLPDGGAINTCDPAEQDCPTDEKCTGYVVEPGYCCVDANKCVPVIGDGQLGDPCTRTMDNDDCDVGLFCMTKTSGSTGDGVCLAFCDVAAQDCSEDGLPDAQCIAFNDGTLPLCQDDCDPVVQDCGDSLGCYGVGDQGFVCSLPGFDEGLGNDGDACFTVQSCKPGLGCTAAEVLSDCGSGRCCTPYCDLNDVNACVAPEECVPYYEEGTAPPNYQDVGLCAVPA